MFIISLQTSLFNYFADRKFKTDAQTDSWTVEKSAIVPAQRMNIITHQPEYYTNLHNMTNKKKEINLSGTHNAAWEKRQQDLANERAKKERIFKERQEYHRFVRFCFQFFCFERSDYAPIKVNPNLPPLLQDTDGDWYCNVSKTRPMPHYTETLYGDTIRG